MDIFIDNNERYPIVDNLSEKSGQLHWDRANSFPIRSNLPAFQLTADYSDTMRLVPEFHCRLFDMSIKEDLEMYQLVKQRAAYGWYSLVSETKKWDSASEPMKIWLEWTQNYYEP